MTPGRDIGLLLALVPYLPLSGLEGQECLVTAPQLVSADIGGVEELASLLPGSCPVMIEPNRQKGGHLITGGGVGSAGSPSDLAPPG